MCHGIRILIVRVSEQKSAIRATDIPHRQISGGRHHLAIVIVREIAVGILIEVVKAAPLQQPCLIRLPIRDKMVDGLLQRHPAAQQRNILSNQCSHPGLELFGIKVINAGHIHIHAGADGTVHLCHRFRPKLPHGKKDHELCRAAVGFPTRCITIMQQPHFAAGGSHSPAHGRTICAGILLPDRNVIQRKDFACDFGRQRTAGKFRVIQSQLPHQFQQTLPRHRIDLMSINSKIHIHRLL